MLEVQTVFLWINPYAGGTNSCYLKPPLNSGVEQIGDFFNPNPVKNFLSVIWSDSSPVDLSKYLIQSGSHSEKTIWLSILLQWSMQFGYPYLIRLRFFKIQSNLDPVLKCRIRDPETRSCSTLLCSWYKQLLSKAILTLEVQTVAFKSTPNAGGTNSCYLSHLYAPGTNSCFLNQLPTLEVQTVYKELLSNQPLHWRYKQLLSDGIPTLEVQTGSL